MAFPQLFSLLTVRNLLWITVTFC